MIKVLVEPGANREARLPGWLAGIDACVLGAEGALGVLLRPVDGLLPTDTLPGRRVAPLFPPEAPHSLCTCSMLRRGFDTDDDRSLFTNSIPGKKTWRGPDGKGLGALDGVP